MLLSIQKFQMCNINYRNVRIYTIIVIIIFIIVIIYYYLT